MTVNEKIPWRRLSLEAGAIVGSILLAFAIDAWWDTRQARAEEQLVLAALKSEFQHNLNILETELGYREAVRASTMEILNASLDPTSFDAGRMDQLISDMVWWGKADFSTGALDNVLLGGGLSLIENETLRHSLASVPDRYDYVARIESGDYETYRNLLVPYLLSKHASLSQINNSTIKKGRPGTGDQQGGVELPVNEPHDHTVLLDDDEFLGIVVQKRWDQGDSVDGYASLRSEMEQIIRLIDEDLAD